jgi:type I restriction enzyme R subunit
MSARHSRSTVHRETVLEQHLVETLVSDQKYIDRTPDDYDKPLSMDRSLVLRFVKETQAQEWAKLEEQYTTAAEAEFFKQLEKALKTRSTLDVLRQGIKLIPGIKFSLCSFKPRSCGRYVTASRTRMRLT